jgi:valyl-tRNA synthetase
MELSKTYEPKEIERNWYQYWLEKNFFHSEPDGREPFTIVIPPPNVTGVLHMGHMLNNTIQDVLIRKARMENKNACWVPGTDHASIATEAKVVQMLRERGIKKSDLSRDEFLKYAWEWKEKYGGIILGQLKKLGASCDWERTRFTMESNMSEAVTDVFIDLYEKGMIYRGLRMVNWDPQGKTALSDEEVIYKEVNSKLYYVKYELAAPPQPSPKEREHASVQADSFPKGEGQDGAYITVATTRPETILADMAICVHPDDERYKHLHGKKALVPFINREIPIITDTYISMEFGTGCLKVTPAHDINDYEIGMKHGLEVIDVLNEDGTLNEKAQLYVGQDRFAVRKQIAIDLEAAGQIEKIEEYKNQIGTSERTGAVIEPRLSLQWWVNMKKFIAKNPQVLDAVMSDEIKFHPAKFKNTYRHWIENIKDWCISRQLWWGQRIPAWYDEQGNYIVARTHDEALAKYKIEHPKSEIRNLKQDEDVVDTWFSSWLWPISVFDGFKDKNNKDIKYYYPTNDLVTAPEIMFFWVARMIMAGYEWTGKKPFSNVYYTGIVRDKLGRKMSKSLGNSPDPLELIEKYSADGVRVGMLLCSPAGNDLPFDEKLCEQGRNFCNKIWNALRLIKGWEEDIDIKSENIPAINWMEHRINETIAEINHSFAEYKLSEALMSIYKLIWDDFCSWYLEMVKPAPSNSPEVGGKPVVDKYTLSRTVGFFETLIQLAHPFMPFITEEVWHQLQKRGDKECIIISQWPKADATNKIILEQGEIVKEVIMKVREIRNQNQIKPREPMKLFIQTANKEQFELFKTVLVKLGVLSEISFVEKEVANTKSFIVKQDRFYVEIGQVVDASAEKEKLTKELEYTKGFIQSVQSKLSNERFVQNAKADVLDKEKQKLADGEAKLKLLQESLAKLN